MAELNIRSAEVADLDATVTLMALGFPGAQKFTNAFLRWQYYANPVGPPLGCNIDGDDQLIGHLMGIPIEVTLRGERQLVTLIMNIAVHPAQRGRGLINALVNHVIAASAARGHAGVIGVANQQSVAAFEHKLGFQNVAGLDAYIEWLPHRIAMDSALKHAEFVHCWSDASLAWRMSNPANPLQIVGHTQDSLIVEGASSLPLLRTRAVIARTDLTLTGHDGLLPRPAVVLGLTPHGSLHHRLALAIPQRLRPSPLRLIYFDHGDRLARLNPQRILFNFLDFDAF
jgi:ribosomal protein S18 acetylase RimI-like enzyme